MTPIQFLEARLRTMRNAIKTAKLDYAEGRTDKATLESHLKKNQPLIKEFEDAIDLLTVSNINYDK